jgi:hypothetical protein
MFRKVRSRLTYANLMATAAMFVALGGSAYAAATIGSAQVIDNSLQSIDLKDNAAVKSVDVVNDSTTGGGLRGQDIIESQLGKVPDADRVDGIDSSSFVRNSTYRIGQGQERAGTALSDGSKVLSQSCLAGDRLLSGGPASVNASSDVLDSFARDTSTWQARINDSAVSGGDSFTVVALCADQ